MDTHLFVRFDGPLRTFDSILRETLVKEMAASGALVFMSLDAAGQTLLKPH